MKQICLLSLIFVLSAISYAQGNTGRLAGSVKERQNNKPLVGVNIVVNNTKFGAATDEKGDFFISDLSPGSYNLSVYYLGYKTILKANVIVNPKRTTILNFEMEEDIFEGETIEATASYFEKAKEAVVSTRSMDFEEIRRSPGSVLDLQRVMQALPAVVSGTDQNNEIIIRGGIPGENLFLIDNIEIPNPNHFGEQGTGGGPINMVNTYMVRKVDFYAGAFSAKYGDKASSVMDIFFRDGLNTDFRAEGYIGMAGAGVLIEGPTPNINGSYIFSARKSFLDLIISSTGLVAVPKYQNMQAKVTLNLSPKNTFLFNAIYGNDKINIENEGTGGYSRGAENVDYSGDQYAFGATLKTLWSNKLFSNTTISNVKSNWDVDVYRTKTGDTYFRNISKEMETAFKTEFVYQLQKNIELDWGVAHKIVDFEYDIGAEPDTIFWFSGPTDPEPDSVYIAYPAYTDNEIAQSAKSALYFQMSVDLLKKLRFTSGLRYDYFNYNNFSSLSPRVGVSYFFDKNTTFNFAYGTHYQSPSYVELTAHPLNKNLKNKYTQQFVLGVDRILREDIKITIESYYKEYFDVPVNRSQTTKDPFDSFQGERVNMGTGYSQGIEFFLQKKLTKRFSMLLSYAHSLSQAKDPRYGTYYDWDYDFKNVFTFISGYKISLQNKNWFKHIKDKWWYHVTNWLPLMPADEIEFSIKFRYLGGRPYTKPTYRPFFQRWLVLEGQDLNSFRYPEYNRLDLRIDRRIIATNFNMVFFFDLINIYNRHNLWEYQYNDDGTREKILQFEVFPVGGFSIEF